MSNYRFSSESVPVGPRGIVLAIIEAAADDLVNGTERQKLAAAKWFKGPEYIIFLDYLGLPIDWLPDVMTPSSPRRKGC